MPGNSIYFLI